MLYIELIGHNFFPVFVEKLFAILTEVQEGLQIVILCQIRESDGRVLQVLILDQLSCSGIGGTVGNVLEILQSYIRTAHEINEFLCIFLVRSILGNGHHIADAQVTDILQRLGCEVTVGEGEWQAVAPSWRFDMEIEEDLVEEVARVYGYNNIPDEPVQASLIMGTHREADLSLKRVKTLLNDKGYQEVITYSFVDPKVQQMIHPGVEALLLPSPISVEMSAMRLSLWTGLLATVVYNQNRQQNRVRIFESGLRFVPDTQAPLGSN